MILKELSGAELPALIEVELIAALGMLLRRAIPAEQMVYDIQNPFIDFPPRPILPFLWILGLPFLDSESNHNLLLRDSASAVHYFD